MNNKNLKNKYYYKIRSKVMVEGILRYRCIPSVFLFPSLFRLIVCLFSRRQRIVRFVFAKAHRHHHKKQLTPIIMLMFTHHISLITEWDAPYFHKQSHHKRGNFFLLFITSSFSICWHGNYALCFVVGR